MCVYTKIYISLKHNSVVSQNSVSSVTSSKSLVVRSVYRQVACSLLIHLRVNRVVNISRLYFSTKICTDELIRMKS